MFSKQPSPHLLGANGNSLLKCISSYNTHTTLFELKFLLKIIISSLCKLHNIFSHLEISALDPDFPALVD